MSTVTNIVLQVGTGEEAIVDQINLIAHRGGIGPLYEVNSEVPGSRKLLEVGVFLMTLNGEDELAAQIESCVRNYREEVPELSDTVLILTRHDQCSEVIRPSAYVKATCYGNAI